VPVILFFAKKIQHRTTYDGWVSCRKLASLIYDGWAVS
jgi:hypothetical protein